MCLFQRRIPLSNLQAILGGGWEHKATLKYIIENTRKIFSYSIRRSPNMSNTYNYKNKFCVGEALVQI